MENDYGLIYVLTNPYFNGLVKIGMTRRLDISKRLHELGTAVPEPFSCAYAYKVPIDRLSAIESLLHENYNEKRVGNSEFFRVAPEKVDNLMRGIGSFEAMQSEVQAQIELDERRKKPNMDFFKMGLHQGDTLIFARDSSVTCTIATNKKVLYNGKEVSLSSITHDLLGYASQPSPHWRTEDGRLLTAIYADYVKSEADSLQHTLGGIAKTAKSIEL